MKSVFRGTWRMFQPILHARGRKRLSLPARYVRFFKQWKRYKAAGGDAPFEQLFPNLFDADPSTQSGGGHYFYQDIWALRRLAAFAPQEHHDISSRFDGFVGQATAICKVICWDIRPPNFRLPNFEFREGSALNLPVPDQSIGSLSCLHVAEHVGLGRYGDDLDPLGTDKTLRELARILAPAGQLLFSMPVGKERIEFNGQRIWDPRKPPGIVKELHLAEFSIVNDNDEFLENVSPADFAGSNYACGLYRFERR